MRATHHLCQNTVRFHFGEVTKVPIDALKDYVNFNVLFQCNTVGFAF